MVIDDNPKESVKEWRGRGENGRRLAHTQARCLKLWRPSLSVISAAFMAFYRRRKRPRRLANYL
jgi:hypothetical protein